MRRDPQADPRYRSLSISKIVHHFEVERELRERLLAAPRDERAAAFREVYAELFRRVPWHPGLIEAESGPNPVVLRKKREEWRRFIEPIPPKRILEIGPGSGELLLALSLDGHRCTALEVEPERAKALHRLGARIQVIEGDGTCPHFPDGTFDIVISQQLFEHLHPEDALDHLRCVHRILTGGGLYLLETPSKVTGPHDISKFFVPVGHGAMGFHLKEYTVWEMGGLFRQAGYRKVEVIVWRRRAIPLKKAMWLELVLRALPAKVRLRHTFGIHNPIYRARA